MAVTFDTLKFLDDLEKAQVPREQARAIVQVVREASDATDVATRGDLRNEVALVRKDLEVMRKDIIIKIGGMLMIGFGIVIGLLKFG